jgi:hypothetical protein
MIVSSQLRISQELFFFVVPESFPRETSSVMLSKNDVATALGSRKKNKKVERLRTLLPVLETDSSINYPASRLLSS